MTDAKVYLDEDVHGLIADTLRLRGRDVLTTIEAGRSGATDPQQLDFATSQGRILVSYNVTDFPRMHDERIARGEHHAGIIVGTQESPRLNAKGLLLLLDMCSAQDFVDQLLYLNNWFD